MEKVTEQALRDFAEFLDEGFNADDPLAQRFVDDFIVLNSGKYKSSCCHDFTYIGDGDKQCKKCHIIE